MITVIGTCIGTLMYIWIALGRYVTEREKVEAQVMMLGKSAERSARVSATRAVLWPLVIIADFLIRL
jgi:hypothetical protein